MSAPRMPDDLVRIAGEAYLQYGATEAARRLGLSRAAMDHRVNAAVIRGFIKREDRVGGPSAPAAMRAEMTRLNDEVPAQTISTEAPTPASALADSVRRMLMRGGKFSLDGLGEALKASRGQVLDAIDELQTAGSYIREFDGVYEIAPTQQPGYLVKGRQFVYESRPDNTYVFGACGDTHIGSKYARVDALHDFYNRCEQAGVDRVFHTGNWIDGYKKGINDHDVVTGSIEGQMRLLTDEYPTRKGIVTYAVSGDDHEGWWAQREGVDIGAMAEQKMRAAGRNDWVDLGYMESHIILRNSNTGKEAVLAVVHPGGGSAYADSYSIQKIIESIDGGEKPAVGLYGHYHKLISGEYRNVWWAQTGCFQDQTPFARKKKLRFAVGGLIVKCEQDPETGAILTFSDCKIRYFVRGYYNDRWSHSGSVQLPERTP